MTPARRVLVLSTSFPLRSGASAGIFVRRFVEALPESVNATVVCPGDQVVHLNATYGRYRLHAFRYGPRRWQRLAQGPGGVMPALKARPWLGSLLPALLIAMAWRVFRAVREADVVHANWAVCGAIAALALVLRRQPMVVTLRGDDVTLAWDSRLQRLMLGVAVRRAAIVVCVADSMREAVARLYPSATSRLRVVFNGVGDEYLGLPPPAWREGTPVQLLAVGSLIRRKGHDLLLVALAQIRPASFRLTLVGDGPERKRLIKLADDLGLSALVEFCGEVPPDRMPEYLAHSDLFVLPSRSEGRPNVVLEAMAAARPVVAFAIAGVTDLVKSGIEGWLAAAEDVGAFTAMLTAAIDDEGERLRRGAGARRRVTSSGWTWSATGAAYAGLYEQAITSVSRGGS